MGLRCVRRSTTWVAAGTSLIWKLHSAILHVLAPYHTYVDRLLAAWRIQVVPLTVEQARLARAAYRDYGRGSGHPARLNLGDCFAYALAADTGQSLLFKGDDFMHTDIPQALESEG